ncbi:MAG: hypothetical protein AB7N71_11110, partial [Phycisphaerae bacterium]
RELIRLHPDTRKDGFDVWVSEFADSSINIFMNVFFESPDWSLELEARHHFAMGIMRLAKRLGIEFAYPTQTIHLEKASAEVDAAPPDRPALPSDARGAGAVARSAVDEILKEFPYPVKKDPAKDAPNA